MLRGSVFGPLLFLIYINDLNNAVKHSDTHHFKPSKSLKVINKTVNSDLKYIVHWSRADSCYHHSSSPGNGFCPSLLIFILKHPNISYSKIGFFVCLFFSCILFVCLYVSLFVIGSLKNKLLVTLQLYL